MPIVRKQAAKGVKKPKASTSVIDRISGIAFDEDEGISINLYGRSGTGKTTLAATFPGPILWIICSGGANPGELRSVDTAENRKKIEKVVIHDPREIIEVVDYQKETEKYKTVVVDHLSDLQGKVLAQILKENGTLPEDGELPPQLSWGLATQQDYGTCTLRCKEIIKKVLDLRCNRVLIAQERDFTPSEDGLDGVVLPYVASALTPSLVGWLNPACDYICETFIQKRVEIKTVTINGKKKEVKKETGKVDYCLRTTPNSIHTVKFRVPKENSKNLPDVIVDPSYATILKLIKG